MNERKRQAVVASCHKRIDSLAHYDEQELLVIINQSIGDKGVLKHALSFARESHKLEEQAAFWDD